MNDKQIKIDSSVPVDGRTSIKKQAANIIDAREYIQESNKTLSNSILETSNRVNEAGVTTKNVEELNDAFKKLTSHINEQIKKGSEQEKANAKLLKAVLDQTNATKEMDKLYKNFGTDLDKLHTIQQRGVSKWEDAFDAIDNMDNALESFGRLDDIVKELNKNLKKLNTTEKDKITKNYNASKSASTEASTARKQEKAEYGQRAKEGSQSVGKVIKDEIGKLGDNLSQLMNTININRLASQLAPTSRQLLQSDLQTTYGLSGSEFETFKKDLYGQINTSNYTNEEIMNAMNALNTTALGSTHTATKYFNDIIRGQKVLGMSAETQKKLLELGNLTGRNELTFYQNQVAKYLNSSLGLNKQQLDQLVNLNASLQTQAADIGIATEEFQQMSMNEGAAFERTSTGFGAKYTQAISSLLGNTDTAAALLGMDSGELSGRLARGESFIDLLKQGQGSSAALNVLRNGTAEEQTRYFEHAKAAWGVDANTWSVLRLIAQNESSLNKYLQTATSASQQNGEAAMKTLEERSVDSLTAIQKAVNKIQNEFSKNIPWKILQELTSIGTILVTLISTMKIMGNINNILGGFKGLGGIKGAGALSSTAKAASMFGGLGLGLIGTGIGIMDAQKMSGSTGNGVTDALRGFALGTGSKEQSTGQKVGSTIGNAAKWGTIGAGAAMLLGGPVGWVAGGAALLGGALGLFGTTMSDKRKAEQAEQERAATLKAIEENTRDTAFNTAKNGVGMVYRYRGTSNYSTMSGTGGIGESSGFKYGVTSRYGPREPIRTDNGHITSSFHSGTDFGAPEGAPLYANTAGVVAAVGKDAAGANYVGITGSDGYTHWYWHMKTAAVVSTGQRVEQGQLVGYVGHTGNAKGSHLHYTVTKPGHTDWWNAESTVDSLPFATQSIFSGGSSTYAPLLDVETNTVQSGINAIKTKTLTNKNIGSIAAPIVNSIGDLKQTIIDLSDRTSRNEKIMNALMNRTIQSPTI